MFFLMNESAHKCNIVSCVRKYNFLGMLSQASVLLVLIILQFMSSNKQKKLYASELSWILLLIITFSCDPIHSSWKSLWFSLKNSVLEVTIRTFLKKAQGPFCLWPQQSISCFSENFPAGTLETLHIPLHIPPFKILCYWASQCLGPLPKIASVASSETVSLLAGFPTIYQL